jgi:formate dehydrogenase subunit beta
MSEEKETSMDSEQNKKNTKSLKGKILSADQGTDKAIVSLLKESLEKKCFDALLIPSQVPETDSYTWLLVQEESLLDLANPLPPVMTVQGGKALSSLTKHGKMDETVAALMRPCEIRAAVELFKLKQIDLDNICLISIDCPGAVPLSDYMADPKKMTNVFEDALAKWGENDSLRPACQICHRFSLSSLLPSSPPKSSTEQNEADRAASDLHIGLIGGDNKKIFLIPVTPKGEALLEKLGLSAEESVEKWESEVNEAGEKKLKKREAFHKEWRPKIEGTDRFAAVFDECINCHNCMRACPVCYCQQCYFDSQFMSFTPEAYLERAGKRGALRFPLDTLLFHVGRMSHMLLSCVSCGACEDACPMSISVGRVFTAVGDQTQEYFNYIPGRDRGEPLPLQIFLEEEFGDAETPREDAEISTGEAKENV